MSPKRLKPILCLAATLPFLALATDALAGQGASRMLYAVPNTAFVEQPSGETVVTVNDSSGSIATVQSTIASARAANPTNVLVIRLLTNATYVVSSASLTLDSHECLVAAGATIKAASASVTVPLIQINSGATNVSVAGGTFDGGGANINAIYAPLASRVNVDKVTAQNCGSDCILLKGNGNSTYNSEMTVTRCEASGSAAHAGISIQNCTQAAVVDNYCHNNSAGIWLACAYGTFGNNVCNSNTTGIDFASGNDNVIANNTCNYNGTGIVAAGSATMIVSDSLGNNSVAGISSSGSGNIYIDNLFTSGNAVNFISGGSGDKVIAYKGPLNASGQDYFYPPLISDQHTNTIVNGLGRTDVTISSTTIDSVQSQYNSARSANPNNVIVLHLNGTFTVGATALTLQSNSCVLLNGTIQISSSTGASAAITGGTSPSHVSISGGIIDGGGLTGNNGVYFTSTTMLQLDGATLRNFGPDNPRVGSSDVVRFTGGATPQIITRCLVNGGAARGIWFENSGIKRLASDNEVTAVNEDGVDCDASTSGSVVKFNYCHDLVRYGVFFEQSASHNLALGNVCNNTGRDINLYNNSATPRGDTAYNNVICNSLMGNNGLRNGSTSTNVVQTSHNFLFDNTVVNASISSELYGTQNYYSQNYLSGGSLSTAGTEAFFNSTDVTTNLYVQDSASGLAVQVQNAATSNSAPVVIAAVSGLGNDQWALIPTDSGWFQIKNEKSGLDLNVSGASLSAGAPVIQFAFGSGQNDQWMPMSAGNGLWYLVNRHSGLCLDVPGTASGTQLDQQPYTGLAGQQFNLALNPPVVGPLNPFALSASPPSQTVLAGATNTFTVTLATNTNFTGSVTFGLSGLPANTTANFSPASLSGSGTSTLTVGTTTNTPVGVYPLTISGAGSTVTNTTGVSLVVNSGVVALPGTLLWTSTGDWSVAPNWTNVTAGGFGPPGISNGVVFTNIGTVGASALTSPGSGVVIPANINSVVDGSYAIIALTNLANALNISPVYQNLGLAAGATLTAGNVQVGGFGAYDFGANNVVDMTISGAGAALVVTNGGLTVSQGSGSSGAHDALLDLSGLDNFTMTGTQIRLGVENVTRAGGILYLARTNTLTLLTAGYGNADGSGSPYSGNPALYLGHNKSAVGNGAQLYLGISNSIAADYVTVGRGDANTLLAFNPAFLGSAPSAYISGTNGGASRVGVYVVGDNSAGEGGSVSDTNDFTGGTVSALVNYLCVGRGREGASDTTTCSGYLTFNTGGINANTLAIGFLYPNGSNSFANGTVNVNGGTLTVMTNVTLASRPATGGTGATQGTLNINGGTVQATNVTGAGGTAIINLNSGTLDLEPGWAAAPGVITNISTLNLGNGLPLPAQLINASVITVSNSITIAANGTLAGNTAVTAPALVVNGTVSPGAAGVGTITSSGNTTFGAGGSFLLAVQNVAGTPGSGWDFLQTAGKLDVQSMSTNPFTIRVESFVNGQIGDIANFSADTNYDWTIVTATGGVTNFNAAKFAVDTSFFGNDLGGGYFYLRTNSNSLVLSFTNNHPPVAATFWVHQNPGGLAMPIASLVAGWSDPDGDPVILGDVSDTSTNGVPLSSDSQFIHYTNANDVADLIAYTVQDVRTNPPAVYRPGDTQRTATGIIRILPALRIGNVQFGGATLSFNGSNGVPGMPGQVLSSTNVTLPLSQWQTNQTITFDAGGGASINITNPAATNPQAFYILKQ